MTIAERAQAEVPEMVLSAEPKEIPSASRVSLASHRVAIMRLIRAKRKK